MKQLNRVAVWLIPFFGALICAPTMAQSSRSITSQAHARSKLSFSFPDAAEPVRSSAGVLFATYTQEAIAQDSVTRYLFSITDQGGTRLVQHNFSRSVEGAWSPYGDQIFLNDFMGSTQIDCLVWTRGETLFTSLTEMLLRDPNSGPIEGRGAKPPETPENSRYELTCEDWLAKDQVSATLEGTTWAGGQFKYRLIYDLRAKKFRWR